MQFANVPLQHFVIDKRVLSIIYRHYFGINSGQRVDVVPRCCSEPSNTAAQLCIDRGQFSAAALSGRESVSSASWGHVLHGAGLPREPGREWALCYLPPNTKLVNASLQGSGRERESPSSVYVCGGQDGGGQLPRGCLWGKTAPNGLAKQMRAAADSVERFIHGSQHSLHYEQCFSDQPIPSRQQTAVTYVHSRNQITVAEVKLKHETLRKRKRKLQRHQNKFFLTNQSLLLCSVTGLCVCINPLL